MASRDLSMVFVERRNAANLRRRSSSDSKGSSLLTGRRKPFGLSSGDDQLLVEEGLPPMRSSSSSSTLPPRWVDDVDAVHGSLADIARLMTSLASLHASRLGSIFGNDLERMEEEIQSVTQDITDKFRHAETFLKRVGAATRAAGGEEATVGNNVQRSLAKKLQELSAEFRQKQRKYLQDVRIQKGDTTTENEDKFGIDFHVDDDGDHRAGAGGTAFSAQQLTVVDDLREAVQSRDQEISKIAQSIEELGSIFKELAVLVIDQGTILDRIDYNMETVVEHTKEGIVQLQQAERHQKSARPMKCILVLLCLIGVLLLILVWKHRRRRG